MISPVNRLKTQMPGIWQICEIWHCTEWSDFWM